MADKPDKHRPPIRTLIVEPDDDVFPVVGMMASAQRSLDVKQFTLSEPRMVVALVDAHRRGVAVRVMLNPHRSSGDRANDDTYGTLERAGIPVRWTNPAFAVTHEKSLVIDGTRALIATFNLVLKYFTETRDYGIATSDPAQVAEVAAGFEADWNRQPFAPDEHIGLTWSTANSRRLMALFIDGARKTLDVQHPKFVDSTVVDRLVDAQSRGVHVRVLCGGKHGISDADILDTFSSLRILRRFGVRVHRQKHLKLHAKLLLADGSRALVGSMNIDRSAFDLRRELGIVVSDTPVVDRLAKVYEHDWERSHRYDAPDPLTYRPHPDDGELPHDPHFVHE
ncbi:MAG: phospholipase D-like domain-containing protein [Candidatus Rokubacteria bacterium]|nr:phospholipase D-like domain-containing protein [Candidatus Rokubacteria bacterium]